MSKKNTAPPTPKRKLASSGTVVTVLMVVALIVMIALVEQGWKPQNAFLAGIFLFASPGLVIGVYRLWVARENLKRHLEFAEMAFRARRLEKERLKNSEVKKK